MYNQKITLCNSHRVMFRLQIVRSRINDDDFAVVCIRKGDLQQADTWY
jgi:hypothetical protein